MIRDWTDKRSIGELAVSRLENALQPLIRELAAELTERDWTLATAESCTGGGIASLLTSLAGSSGWFGFGWVTYANAAKIQMLDVDPALLQRYGAVSSPVAAAMAEGAAHYSRAQVALSVTGVAGPGGGSATKPVGTVWFGWKLERLTLTRRRIFSGDRASVRAQSVIMALDTLLCLLREQA